MIRQTNLRLIGYIGKYGCLFMVLTYWFFFKITKMELPVKFLNTTWDNALEKGIISGDLDDNGDLDGRGECEIQDKDKLMALSGVKKKYLGNYEPTRVPKRPGLFYIGEFYNARTGFTHFVGLDENLAVEYDPIKDSVTVREGKLVMVKVFE